MAIYIPWELAVSVRICCNPICIRHNIAPLIK
jgi:hypothetical protein